ncbi:MAG: SDR family oxidoreductase [Pseudomonadota bacterium]
MIDFSGQRVVITGATGGVGRALIETFHTYGAEIIGYDVAGADFDGLPVKHIYQFDLTDKAALQNAMRDTCTDRPPPAAVISNAGWTRAETLNDVTPEAFEKELNVNFKAAAELAHAFLPIMRDKGGAFVFISSVNALTHFGNPAYAAAKAGLLAWSRAIATEEGCSGIRSNAIAPGSILTPNWAHRLAVDPNLADRLKNLYPLGRFVLPEEVAQTAAFLASPLAGGITGATIPVDAGLMAGNMPFLNEIASL